MLGKEAELQHSKKNYIDDFLPQNNTNLEEKKEKNDTYFHIFMFFVKNFTKFYGIRIIYSLYHVFSSNKSKVQFNYNLFFKTIFSLTNVRTALFGSVMPALYKILMKMFKTYFDSKYEPQFLILSSLISSLIGILIEEKTTLVNFIILSVFVRVIHNLILIFLEKYNIPYQGKIVNFLVFMIVASAFIYVNFCHPSYAPIRKIVDGYALYTSEVERREMNTARNALRLI
jgi:hypothetical protein